MTLGNEDVTLEVSEIVRDTVSHISLDGSGETTFSGDVYIDNHGFGGTPQIALAVGDSDTGLNSETDGELDFYQNNTIQAKLKGSLFDFSVGGTEVKLGSDLTATNGETIWNESNTHIPSSVVQSAGLDADTVDGFEAADLRNSSNVLQLSSTNTTLDINQSTWTSIPFDVQQILDGAFSHDASSSPETITFDEAGRYRVNVSLAFDGNGGTRVNPGIKFNLNGTRLDTQALSGYIRGSSGHDEGSNTVSRVIDVSAGDTLKVQTIEQGDAGTVTLRSNESVLTIEQLSASTAPISDAETLDGLDSTAFVKTDGSTPITSAQAISQSVSSNTDYLKLNNTTSGDEWDFEVFSDNNFGFRVNNSTVFYTDPSNLQTTFSSRLASQSGFDAGGNSIDNSTEVNTPGGGSDSFDVYDSANGQDIAQFTEGGNVSIPNGKLTVQGESNDAIELGDSIAEGGSSSKVLRATETSYDFNGLAIETTDESGSQTQRIRITTGQSDTGGNTSKIEFRRNDIYEFRDGSIYVLDGDLILGDNQFEHQGPNSPDARTEWDGTNYVVGLFSGTNFENQTLQLGRDNNTGTTQLPFGNVEIPNGDLTDGGNIIYDQSASHIPQARLQNDSVTVNAGTDLTTGGSVALGGSVTIDHANTSSQGNVSAPSGGAISDVNLDGNGHVTSLSTVDFDGRFVAESGDSMTGRLSMDGNDVYFQPNSAGGSVTGLTFESNTNAGSDFGYIEYHDDYFGGGEESAIVLRTENDPTDKIVLDGAGGTYVETGPFDLASNDLEDSGTTIWDTSASYIPQGRLQNDSLTVAGNSVSLGGSTSVAHSNLTGIGSSDHHSRYADGEAVSAVESNRVQDIGFDNIEDPSRTRAIGIDDSEGPLFKDSGGSTYSLWNSKYVSGGTDISISGGVGAGDGYVTIDHANTSSQGNVSTGGATVIDDIDLDGNGHVININTQNRSLDDWNDANSAINLSGNGIASVGNLNVSSIDSNNGSNPVRIDQALEYQDDTESFFGNNADFSAKYDSSSDEWVLRDETNGVDLIRQPKAGPTQFIQGADIGSIEAPEDSFTQVINAANTSSTTSGDTVGYTFAVDNQSLLSVQAESDGSGGIQNKKLLGPDGSELGGISFPLTFPDNDSDGNNWQIAEDGTNGHLNFTSDGGGGAQMDLEHNGNLRLEGELTEGAAL